MTLYQIPPGLFCVPAAIYAITGADLEAVIVPSINRHSGYKYGLHDTVTGVMMSAARAVLEELGYKARRYKDGSAGPLRAHLATWARRSKERYPGLRFLLATRTHCLALCDGVVHDTFTPFGESGSTHPFAKTTVTWLALIEPPAV